MNEPPFDLSNVSRETRETMIFEFGNRCAAWLLGIAAHRRRIRKRNGQIVFYLPASADLPPWFDYAIAYLEKYRSRTWSVEHHLYEYGTRKQRMFVVTRKRAPVPRS